MVKLFIAGFPKNMSEAWFGELFGQFGIVSEIGVIKDEKLDSYMGYGFITMKDLASAEEAISTINDSVIEGHQVSVKLAQAKDTHSAM